MFVGAHLHAAFSLAAAEGKVVGATDDDDWLERRGREGKGRGALRERVGGYGIRHKKAI